MVNIDNVPNRDSSQKWNGRVGQHWVDHQQQYDAMLGRLTPRLMEAARIGPADRVLDLGCGCGETSRLATRLASAGSVVGLDISAPMLDRAAILAAGLPNLTFLRADTQTHPFTPGSFDVALSRFGAIGYDDPVAAFANVAGALRPGGRLALLVWQSPAANEWLTVAAVPIMAAAGRPGGQRPFAMADPEVASTTLTSAGFTGIDIAPVAEPLWFGASLDDALAFFKESDFGYEFFSSADPETAERVLDAVRVATTPFLRADGLWLGAGCWLVTANTPMW